MTVHYDASSRSYTVSTSGRSQTFAPTDLQPSAPAAWPAYKKTQGAVTDHLTLIGANPHTSEPLTYVGLGFWQRNQTSNSIQDTSYDAFTYGIPAPEGASPRTGGASYEVGLFGFLTLPSWQPRAVEGDGVLNFDFALGTFEARVDARSYSLVDPSDTMSLGNRFRAAGRLSSSDGTFSGQANFTHFDDSSVTGPLTGRFYGPSAQEVGATFSLTGSSNSAMTGSLVGSRKSDVPTENLSLTRLVKPQPLFSRGAILRAYPKGVAVHIEDGETTLYPDGGVDAWPEPVYGPKVKFTPADQVASARPNFTSYETTVDGQPIHLDVYRIGAGNAELALTYTSFGMWRQGGPSTAVSANEVLYVNGLLTPLYVLRRRTGAAHYSGVAYGAAVDQTLGTHYDVKGTSSFDIDFSAQKVDLSLKLSGVGQDGSSRDFGTFGFGGWVSGPDLAATRPTVQILPSWSITGGQLQLNFFGPDAEEIGAPFSINFGGAGSPIAIAGVAVAKRN